jgi:ABC-type nitrate/sulfonate/bicarbonate transport system ATPase subunit
MAGDQPSPCALRLADVSCTFANRDDPSQRYTAVRDVTLEVGAGEFVSVVGPTGCGKSTVLNVAAGLLEPSSGTVESFGARLEGINARAGYMFQAESLMPWRTAQGNVAAGLEFRGASRADAAREAAAWLARVGLAHFGDRYPHQLSGGMRKRTSLAQTLALDPDIILMDEPFSALDIQTRHAPDRRIRHRPRAAARRGRGAQRAALHRAAQRDLGRAPGRGAEGVRAAVAGEGGGVRARLSCRRKPASSMAACPGFRLAPE